MKFYQKILFHILPFFEKPVCFVQPFHPEKALADNICLIGHHLHLPTQILRKYSHKIIHKRLFKEHRCNRHCCFHSPTPGVPFLPQLSRIEKYRQNSPSFHERVKLPNFTQRVVWEFWIQLIGFQLNIRACGIIISFYSQWKSDRRWLERIWGNVAAARESRKWPSVCLSVGSSGPAGWVAVGWKHSNKLFQLFLPLQTFFPPKPPPFYLGSVFIWWQLPRSTISMFVHLQCG